MHISYLAWRDSKKESLATRQIEQKIAGRSRVLRKPGVYIYSLLPNQLLLYFEPYRWLFHRPTADFYLSDIFLIIQFSLLLK